MRFSWKRHWHGIVLLAVAAIFAGAVAQANISYAIVNEAIFSKFVVDSENQFIPHTVSWNADKVAENKTEVHTKWINYLDEQGLWKPIDVTVRDDGSAFVMDEAPFIFRAPKTSVGEAEFISNVRYDMAGRAPISEDPVTMAITAQGVADVPGELFDMTGDGVPESVLYPLAYPDLDADLLYFVEHGTAPVLQKLVRFHQAVQDTDISFRIRTDRALTVEVPREIVAEVDGVPAVDETPLVDEVPDAPSETIDELISEASPSDTPAPVEAPTEEPLAEEPVSEVPPQAIDEPISEESPSDTPAPVEAPTEEPAPDVSTEVSVTEDSAPNVAAAAVMTETTMTIQSIDEAELSEGEQPVSFEGLVRQREEFRRNKQETLRAENVTRRKGTFSFHDGGSMRGFGWRDPVIWDSSGKKERIEVSLERVSPTEFVLTKHIQADFFEEFVIFPVFTDTTTTVFPSAGTGTAGMDGYILNVGSKLGLGWDTIHDLTSGLSDTSSGSLTVRSQMSTGKSSTADIYRAHTGFDTSAIPDTDTISAATVTMRVSTKVNGDDDGDDWINIVQSTPASNTDLVGEDYDQIGAVDNPTEGATRIDLGSMTAGADSTWTLNATGLGWISKTGITNLGWREGHDAIDSPPATPSENSVEFYSADTGGTDDDPTLTITHAAPTGDAEGDAPDSFIID